MNPKSNAKDVFLNLGAIVALYTMVFTLINLLFTVINRAFPQTTDYYYNYGSQSISFPVATLIIAFPVLVLLMWLLEKEYMTEPERQSGGIHKWLTYLTLFFAGITLAGDLITIIYYFIDGRELTAAFLLKVLVLFVVSGGVFMYYISDIKGTLTGSKRKMWRVATALVILASILWGFYVLGSPRTQRLYKYDEQKVNDLMNISNQVQSYYSTKGFIPEKLDALNALYGYPGVIPNDPQSGQSYEYVKSSNTSYNVCAIFNMQSNDNNQINRPAAYPYGGVSWAHPAGHKCFSETINPQVYPAKPLPL